MKPIEFKPDLSCCIECHAKREHWAGVQKLLASAEEDEDLVARVELLRRFLETADFKKLRARSEKWLSQGRQVKFILTTRGDQPDTRMVIE